MPLLAASELGLHCLRNTPEQVYGLKRVNDKYTKNTLTDSFYFTHPVSKMENIQHNEGQISAHNIMYFLFQYAMTLIFTSEFCKHKFYLNI